MRTKERGTTRQSIDAAVIEPSVGLTAQELAEMLPGAPGDKYGCRASPMEPRDVQATKKRTRSVLLVFGCDFNFKPPSCATWLQRERDPSGCLVFRCLNNFVFEVKVAKHVLHDDVVLILGGWCGGVVVVWWWWCTRV